MSTLSEKAVAHALEHMNSDHAHNLLDYARVFGGCDWATSAEMTALDANGFDMLVTGDTRTEAVRLDFDEPVGNPKEMREALVAMARQAASQGV